MSTRLINVICTHQVKASLPGVGGIVDITETGSSLVANKLRVRALLLPGSTTSVLPEAYTGHMQFAANSHLQSSCDRCQGELLDCAQVVDTILSSTTRLVANKAAWEDPAKRQKIEDVALLLQAGTLVNNLKCMFSSHMRERCDSHCRIHGARHTEVGPTVVQAAINGKQKVGLKMNIHNSKLDEVSCCSCCHCHCDVLVRAVARSLQRCALTAHGPCGDR